LDSTPLQPTGSYRVAWERARRARVVRARHEHEARVLGDARVLENEGSKLLQVLAQVLERVGSSATTNRRRHEVAHEDEERRLHALEALEQHAQLAHDLSIVQVHVGQHDERRMAVAHFQFPYLLPLLR
jgi:hypothetical protein